MQAAPHSQVMAVVKANAYGHGAVPVALALESLVQSFGVARVAEAVELRQAGIQQPVTLLEGILDEVECQLAVDYQLRVVVHTPEMWRLVEQTDVPVWLKLNTGMNRLGLSEVQFKTLNQQIPEHRLLGVMSDFSHADDLESEVTHVQLTRLDNVVSDMEPVVALANSAAVLAHPEAHRDWIRPGLMLYGASPAEQLSVELLPAMTFSAPVIAVHQVQAGETVGYNGIWQAEKPTRLAVIAVGYADGYPREIEQAQVHLNGRRFPVVGRVSMDMICVALDDDVVVNRGDKAELWGSQIAVNEVARWAGTLAYTLMCGVSARVPRVYDAMDP